MLTLKLPISRSGVVVEMFVAVSTQYANALRVNKRPIPRPIAVPALLDTGADCTLLDINVAAIELHIVPKNTMLIRCLDAPNTEENRPAFDVDIFFASGKAESMKFTLQVAGHIFSPDLPYKAIIGRDLLAQSTFHYDGPDAEVTFSI